MFSRLKNLFNSEETESSAAEDENPNFITRPRRIKTLLFLLMEDHTQVTLQLSEDQVYSSAIREVTEDGILLDEINSSEGHRLMVSDFPVKVRAKHQAVHLIFESKVKEILKDGYLVSLPDRIYYPQRRSYYRVPLNSVASFGFRASGPYADQPISGRIEDMSYGGVCLLLNNDTYFKKGDLLSPASLVLNDGDVVNCDLVVCTIKRSPGTGMMRLGCEFSDLDANARRAINQFIVYCERDRAKKGIS